MTWSGDFPVQNREIPGGQVSWSSRVRGAGSACSDFRLRPAVRRPAHRENQDPEQQESQQHRENAAEPEVRVQAEAVAQRCG